MLALAIIMTATATLPAKDQQVTISTIAAMYVGHIIDLDSNFVHLNCTAYWRTDEPGVMHGTTKADHGMDIWIGVGQIESMVGEYVNKESIKQLV
jgi:hypothetical protein